MKSFLFSRKLSTKNWTQEILTVEWMTPYLKVPRVVSCFKFLDLHPLLPLLSPFHLIPTFSLSSWLSYLSLFSFAICIIILFSSMQSEHCDLHHMWLHCETNEKLSFLLLFTMMNNHNLFYEIILFAPKFYFLSYPQPSSSHSSCFLAHGPYEYCKPVYTDATDYTFKWLSSNFSLQYHPWITYLGHENQGNDYQLKKLLIVEQILLVSTLRSVSRTEWRKWILMLRYKRLIHSYLSYFFLLIPCNDLSSRIIFNWLEQDWKERFASIFFWMAL